MPIFKSAAKTFANGLKQIAKMKAVANRRIASSGGIYVSGGDEISHRYTRPMLHISGDELVCPCLSKSAGDVVFRFFALRLDKQF
jgi:hypothetical protein